MTRRQKRDLSHAQFLNALDREGFGRPTFLGYTALNVPGLEGKSGYKTMVSILNAGDRRRDQLAYLRQQRRKVAKRYAAAQS